MQPNDASLICRDCGDPFGLPEEERRDFASVGHCHAPSRCCVRRAARKTRQFER